MTTELQWKILSRAETGGGSGARNVIHAGAGSLPQEVRARAPRPADAGCFLPMVAMAGAYDQPDGRDGLPTLAARAA